MKWDWRAMRAIMRKDLQQVFQNNMVWMPMVIVPVIFLIIFPTLVVTVPAFISPSEFDSKDLAPMLKKIPEQFRSMTQGLNPSQQFSVLGANVLFAPMFLIIPLVVSTILGADSFAGEKERKTLEGLLYTPISDTELFVAKLLTALAPAMAIGLASFILYGLAVNLSGYHFVGHVFFPISTWWVLLFWVSPSVALAGLGATVLMSSKAKSFMEAQQLAGSLVLPIVFMMIGQITGLFFLGIGLMFAVGFVLWAIGTWFIWVGAKTFSRGELITRI